MTGLKWWMRIVGAIYLFLFVAAAFLRLPIRAEGPADTLTRAAAGDPLASFAVDTWVTIGVGFAVLGTALLVASRTALQARALAWTVVGWEFGGIVIDLYKLSRGYDAAAPATWIVIHALIIGAGVWLLRSTPPG
jgi:hypothetical protein